MKIKKPKKIIASPELFDDAMQVLRESDVSEKYVDMAEAIFNNILVLKEAVDEGANLADIEKLMGIKRK